MFNVFLKVPLDGLRSVIIVFPGHTQKVSEYDQENHNHTLQTNPRHREEEPQNTNSHKPPERQLKQSNQRSLPRQDDCITRKDTK